MVQTTQIKSTRCQRLSLLISEIQINRTYFPDQFRWSDIFCIDQVVGDSVEVGLLYVITEESQLKNKGGLVLTDFYKNNVCVYV